MASSNIKHGARAHALLSPSSSERWINCTPSAMLESRENDVQSFAALEGTTAHEVAEAMLNLQFSLISATKYNKTIEAMRKNARRLMFSNDMLDHAGNYFQEVEGLIYDFLGVDEPLRLQTVDIEAKINMEPVTGEKGAIGHLDFRAFWEGKLLVVDYKYGMGTRVDAEKNPQLRNYALGSLIDIEARKYPRIKQIMYAIYQPRLNHLSVETISAEGLKQWHKTVVKPAAKLALDGAGKQKAGRWCKYCKVAGQCATLGAEAMKIARQEFDTVHLLTPEQQKLIYDKVDCVEAFIKALKEDMLKKALSGVEFKGLKVVESISKRKWKDEETVKSLLMLNGFGEEQTTRTSLKTIGDIEKLVGKKTFNEDFFMLTEKPKGGPVLAPSSDKRQAFNDVQKDFEEFEADEDGEIVFQ